MKISNHINVLENENLFEKLEVLQDIRMSEQDIAAGKIMSHTNAQKKLLAAIKK